MRINDKNINVYCNKTDLEVLPVVILNSFEKCGKEIIDKCNELNTDDYILVEIYNIDWNNDLTPWKNNPIFKGDNKYLGNADNYIKELEEIIVPEIEKYIINTLNKKVEYYIIAGYSLAGLFSLYSSFKTNIFKKVICVSSSFWYPNFSNYVKENKISENVSKIYFSLGNKEKNSKIELLSTVEDKTKEIYDYLNTSITSIFEENEGNHFKDETYRIAKGIKWIL